MNNDLVSKSVKVTTKQIEWVLSHSGNFSRYIRTLIDREIGAEEARALVAATRERSDNGNTAQKPPQKVTAWNFPK